MYWYFWDQIIDGWVTSHQITKLNKQKDIYLFLIGLVVYIASVSKAKVAWGFSPSNGVVLVVTENDTPTSMATSLWGVTTSNTRANDSPVSSLRWSLVPMG